MKRSNAWVDSSFDSSNVKVASKKPRSKPQKLKAKASISISLSVEKLQSQLWFETFKDLSEDQLCVNKKKVQEIRELIHALLDKPRVVIIRGPSGCGKTETIKSVCKSLRVGLLSWKPEIGTTLRDFLLSRNKSFCSSNLVHTALHVESLPEKSEIPKFIELLELYLKTGHFPLLIESHDEYSSGYVIFPKSLLLNPFVRVVQMNSLAPTFMRKGIEVISNSISPYFPPISSKSVEDILVSSHGDIRLAINHLQLNSLSRSTGATHSKDERLGAFHAIGKILHPKRDEISINICRKCNRNGLTEIPENILTCASLSDNFLLGCLHENFIHVSQFDVVPEILKYLAISDLLSSFSYDLSSNSSISCAAVITVRAIMFYNRVSSRSFAPLHGASVSSSKKFGNKLKNSLETESFNLETSPYLDEICKFRALDRNLDYVNGYGFISEDGENSLSDDFFDNSILIED